MLAAITEVIKENDGQETETEYFAALVSTIFVTEKIRNTNIKLNNIFFKDDRSRFSQRKRRINCCFFVPDSIGYQKVNIVFSLKLKINITL